MTTPKHLSKKQKKSITLILLVAILLMVLFPYAYEFLSPFSTDGEPVEITVSEGSSTRDIARLLKEHGLIKSELSFLLRVKLSGNLGKLRYGTFDLNTGMSMMALIKTFANDGAKKETVMLTVPEGFSAELIAVRTEELGLFRAEEFLKALSSDYDYEFLESIPKAEGVRYPLQGFLFPSTYEFYLDATPHEVIDTMLRTFWEQYSTLPEASQSTNLYETVTLASLVEREAKLQSERKTIAGVMSNRLEIGMALQIDASVVYAVTDGLYDATAVSYKDLKTNSPYNTYKYPGLPVGPICSPGLPSLKAALSPESHDYFYYHTDETKKDGSHIFTKTLEEHNESM